MMNENNLNNMDNETAEPASAEKKRTGTKGKLIALAVCCSIIGGGLGTGGTLMGMKYLSGGNSSSAAEEKDNTSAKPADTIINSGSENSSVTNTVNTANGSEMSAADVYAANVNSTVGITTQITTNYFGYQTTAAASGSGFILSADGYILTNYHVIESATEITVTAYSGDTYKAKLIGGDESNDIAVLKIEAEGLTPVTLGSSDSLRVGDNVVAIGNPLGELTFSLTSGVVSALDREITTTKGNMNLIQTDCAINSGNSGGALFNMKGEVVGITNAKYSSSSMSEASIDNIGFAIPIDSVTSIVNSIVENGYIVKPFIGVSVTDLSQDFADFGIPSGAAVKAVNEDSPAEKAGLKVNDIIVSVNGEKISSSSDLVKIVKSCKAGDKLELEIYRSGETKEITITVEETKQSALDDENTDVENSGSEQQNNSDNQRSQSNEFFNFFGQR